ncbi:MAG: hypothetical protein FWF01_02895 [Alphaproteobacteria bacterium]|nr:hypothetical protein [Alphaproteobacteria bacterium]
MAVRDALVTAKKLTQALIDQGVLKFADDATRLAFETGIARDPNLLAKNANAIRNVLIATGVITGTAVTAVAVDRWLNPRQASTNTNQQVVSGGVTQQLTPEQQSMQRFAVADRQRRMAEQNISEAAADAQIRSEGDAEFVRRYNESKTR